jgi:hypothetical protein
MLCVKKTWINKAYLCQETYATSKEDRLLAIYGEFPLILFTLSYNQFVMRFLRNCRSKTRGHLQELNVQKQNEDESNI